MPIIDLVVQWFLIILFLLEATAKIGLNIEHQLGIVEDHDTYNSISKDQRGTALAVASLVFAGIALILSSEPSKFSSQIELFVVGFGMLLIAAFAHELTLTYRVVLTIQEMALEYGLLFMVYGLFRLVNDIVPEASEVMLIVFLAVFLFRLYSVIGELEAHAKQ